MVSVCALQSRVRTMDAGLPGKAVWVPSLGPMFLNWISLQLGPTVGPGPGCAVNGLLGQIVRSNTVPVSCTGDSAYLTAALCCLWLTLLWV